MFRSQLPALNSPQLAISAACELVEPLDSHDESLSPIERKPPVDESAPHPPPLPPIWGTPPFQWVTNQGLASIRCCTKAAPPTSLAAPFDTWELECGDRPRGRSRYALRGRADPAFGGAPGASDRLELVRCASAGIVASDSPEERMCSPWDGPFCLLPVGGVVGIVAAHVA